MFSKLLLATALTLSLGGTALAQSSSGSTTGGGAATGADATGTMGGSSFEGIPSGWEGDINDAFFTDDMTLRSQDEIASNWGNLSAEQQAQVKADCTSMQASMEGDTEMGDAGGSKPDETTTSATTSSPATGGATGGASASASDQMAAMQELCGWVETQ